MATDAVLQMNALPSENEEQDRADALGEPEVSFQIPCSFGKVPDRQVDRPPIDPLPLPPPLLIVRRRTPDSRLMDRRSFKHRPGPGLGDGVQSTSPTRPNRASPMPRSLGSTPLIGRRFGVTREPTVRYRDRLSTTPHAFQSTCSGEPRLRTPYQSSPPLLASSRVEQELAVRFRGSFQSDTAFPRPTDRDRVEQEPCK